MPSEISAEKLRGVLEIVRLANAETDLGTLVGVVTQQACVLLNAERGSLYLLDKDAGELRTAMAVGLQGKVVRLKLHQGIAGLVAAMGQSIIVDDAYADARFYKAVDETTGYRTRQILCVPIKTRRGDVLGVLELLNKRAGTFTSEDEAVLTILASQVGIALANAQLYDGLRANLDRLTRLLKVGTAISSELDLDALLRTISQTTSHLLQAERSTVFIVDQARKELWSRVAEGLDRHEIRVPLGTGIAGSVASTGQPIRISDAYNDPRFNPEVDKRTGYVTRNILCVPMRNARGQVIGVFQVLNKRGGDFTSLDDQLLASLSSQAAVAVENAKLYDEVQRAYTQLQTADKMKIESLLVFVRLDQGAMALNREALELPPLFAQVMETFKGKAAEQKLLLETDVASGLPVVMADSSEITMALTHLLDNATKFTPAGGRVMVRARPVLGEEGQTLVEIAIQDTGIGIPAELHEKIFERFYQVDSSVTRAFGGVGIGLAVVKQIIEAHGSHVEVESEPGKGSVFRFALPAAG
jgi:signal transduction histidine kinase